MLNEIICGDSLSVLRGMDDDSVQTCITSPPYWSLRDYGLEPIDWPDGWRGCLGLEPSPEMYIDHLVEIFAEVRRVLRKDGTCWVNIGDSYVGGGKGGNPADSPHRKQATNRGSLIAPTPVPKGMKPKDLCLIPQRLAIALQESGWWVRSIVIWAKPNPMPESVRDRPTTGHEYVLLLAKSQKYYYDQDAIREPYTEPLNRWGGPVLKNETKKQSAYLDMQNIGGSSSLRKGGTMRPDVRGRNKRTVWTIPTQPYPEAHFATFPEKLVEPMVLAGAPVGGIVFDPFCGSGTTCAVAERLGRSWIGIDANPEYCKLVQDRIRKVREKKIEDSRQLRLGI